MYIGIGTHKLSPHTFIISNVTRLLLSFALLILFEQSLFIYVFRFGCCYALSCVLDYYYFPFTVFVCVIVSASVLALLACTAGGKFSSA